MTAVWMSIRARSVPRCICYPNPILFSVPRPRYGIRSRRSGIRSAHTELKQESESSGAQFQTSSPIIARPLVRKVFEVFEQNKTLQPWSPVEKDQFGPLEHFERFGVRQTGESRDPQYPRIQHLSQGDRRRVAFLKAEGMWRHEPRGYWSGVPNFSTGVTKDVKPQLLRIINDAIKLDERSAVRGVSPFSYEREVRLRLKNLYLSSYEHRDWGENFAFLVDNVVNGVDRREIWRKLPIEEFKKDQVVKWVTDCRWQKQAVRGLRLAWRKLSPSTAAEYWPIIALDLLLHWPRLARHFLAITAHESPSPPFNMQSDCFWFLETFHYNRVAPTPLRASRFHATLLYNLRPSTWSSIVPSQRGIRLYLRYCCHARTGKALAYIIRWNVNISFRTALYILLICAKQGNVYSTTRAIRLISRRFPTRFPMNKRNLLPFAKALTLDSVVEKAGERRFVVLSEIIKAGIKPNRVMFNIILSNALRDGGIPLGLEVLREMEDRQIGADSITYLQLVDEAVKRADVQRVDLIMEHLDKHEHLVTEPHIVSKILHAIYLHTQVDKSAPWEYDQMFRRMLSVYSRAHDIQPLIDLSILPNSYPQSHSDTKSRPSIHALVLMISAFLRKKGDSMVTCRIVDRFTELVKEGHDAIGPLAEKDYIYNVFLKHLTHDPRMLEKCVSIVRDMSKTLPPTAVLKSENNRPIVPAKPTVVIWTNLLAAFVYKGQFEAIDKIRDMMAAHGVAFNTVTWTMIISSFVSRGMAYEVAGAVRTMLKEGCEINSHTIEAIGRLPLAEQRESVMKIIYSAGVPSEPATRLADSEHSDFDDSEWQGLNERLYRPEDVPVMIAPSPPNS